MNWKTFFAMLSRDGHVARRNLIPTLLQNLLQPLLSGDNSCTDHIIAWKARSQLHMDAGPMGPSPDHNDNMILDWKNNGSLSGFGHPSCKGRQYFGLHNHQSFQAISNWPQKKYMTAGRLAPQRTTQARPPEGLLTWASEKPSS